MTKILFFLSLILALPAHATYLKSNDVMTATCTGCTITTVDNWKIATFSASGTWTVTSGGGKLAEMLLIGGAGGGCGSDQSVGAGGAGRVIYESPSGITFSPGVYTVTVGTGGTGAATGASGIASTFGPYNAPGGGGGACTSTGTPAGRGKDGGSGGGSAYNQTTKFGFATTTGLLTGNSLLGTGYNGCAGAGSSGSSSGGAGGGAGGPCTASVGTLPGNGGPGICLAISGTNTCYAGGGGGGADYGGTAGSGGLGGGGNGGAYPSSGGNGSAPGAGGGGGNSAANTGGNGADGTAILKWKFQ